MSHYRVLIASESGTPESFEKIMSENNWGDFDSYEPFGFDYLCPYTKDNQTSYDIDNAYIFHKSEIPDLEEKIDMVIDSEGKELWWCEGISDMIPSIPCVTALALIPEEHYCCIFDGHL